MQGARNMAEVGVNFTDMRTACNIYKIKNDIKQQFFTKPGKIDIMERIQVVSPDLICFVTPAARGYSLFMAKCTDHYAELKAVYFIWTKDKKLTTLVQFVQDFVMSPGLRLQHLRADGCGEYIANCYCDYSKTKMTILQFD